MRHVVLAIVLVLSLPQAAATAPLGAASGSMLPENAPLERATVPGPEDDVRSDGPRTRPSEAPAPSQPGQAKRDAAADAARADRGLSFGVEIRRRSRFGDLARKDDVEDPSLGDQLDKLIERPVFGLRGRYRF